MAVKFDVVATIGTYTNKNGEKKYITRKVGSMIETQHGDALKLDACFNPSGCKVEEDGSVWLKLFAPKPAEPIPASGGLSRGLGNQQSHFKNEPQKPAGFDSFDDELPPF